MSVTTSRWSRRFVLVGALSLCCWQGATLVGAPRGTVATLAVQGFVLHVAFGKAYALIPAYFDADLRFDRAPAVQFPATAVGTVCLAAAPLRPFDGSLDLAAAGSVLWLLGAVVFAGTLLATLLGPLRRGATGTGEHNVDRRGLDRFANAFVPVVLGYLVVGSYETAAVNVAALPALIGVRAAATHLLAVGVGALLVFAVGFRLLPRFFGAHPSRRSAAVVLLPGAVAPAFLAAGFRDMQFLMVGAVLLAAAVVAFAVAVFRIGLDARRRRVGLYGVLAGATFGVVGVALGVHFATGGAPAGLIGTHLRLNLLGFLGLVIVGVSFQFYPPSVGTFPGSSDHLAAASMVAIAAGLVVETVAALTSAAPPGTTMAGHGLALVGSLGYGYSIVSTFTARSR